MKASILDLRYRMKDVLSALDRNEIIEILYHGILKGMLMPTRKKPKIRVSEHPFFAQQKEDEISVDAQMQSLRGGRY